MKRKKTVDGPRKENGQIYMSKNDVLRCELSQSKTTEAIQRIALIKNSIVELQREYEAKVRNAQAELAATTAHAKQMEEKSQLLWKEMSEVYKIDFSKAAYDDETGLITLLEG